MTSFSKFSAIESTLFEMLLNFQCVIEVASEGTERTRWPNRVVIQIQQQKKDFHFHTVQNETSIALIAQNFPFAYPIMSQPPTDIRIRPAIRIKTVLVFAFRVVFKAHIQTDTLTKIKSKHHNVRTKTKTKNKYKTIPIMPIDIEPQSRPFP